MDLNTVISGASIRPLDASEIFAKGIQDFAAQATSNGTTFDFRTPVDDVVDNVLTRMSENVGRTEVEDAMTFENKLVKPFAYSLAPKNGFDVTTNANPGDVIKAETKRTAKSINVRITPYYAPYRPEYEDLVKWGVFTNNNYASYVQSLFYGSLLGYSHFQMTDLLSGLVSKPDDITVNFNETVVFSSDATDFDKFNFTDGFENKIVYADNTLTKTSPNGTAEGLTDEKLDIIIKRLYTLNAAKPNGSNEIFIILPLTLLEDYKSYLRVRYNFNSTGIVNEWVKQIFTIQNEIMGGNCLYVSPTRDSSVSVKFIGIPDYKWTAVFGAKTRKSFKDNTQDVYHIFAMNRDALMKFYNNPIVEVTNLKYGSEGLKIGVGDQTTTRGKWAARVINPNRIVAVEVLAKPEFAIMDSMYGVQE